MNSEYLDRNLALETFRVTEMAALSSSLHMGRGDENAADQSAVNAMRNFLNSLMISGKVVIGEGERDKAPMLYIGEKVGKGGPKVDIALDPLEGTTITAQGGENALSVLAMGGEGSFLHCPDIYMYKIAFGKNYQDLDIDPNEPADKILRKFAEFADIKIENVVVCTLDRPRHNELITSMEQCIEISTDNPIISSKHREAGKVEMYCQRGGKDYYNKTKYMNYFQ